MSHLWRLRELREKKGWTLVQLAAETRHRVSASTISRIEQGAVVPVRRTREDLAAALGVSINEIAWPDASPAQVGPDDGVAKEW